MVYDTVKVVFRLFVGSELELSEEEINVSLDVYRSRLRTRNRYDGAIIINSPGQPIVQAEDELPAIVKNICFGAIPDLIAGKKVVIGYYDHYGELRLEPQVSNILISGDDIPTITVPCREFLPALYDCGQRFIRFLTHLKGEASDRELEDLIRFLADIGKVASEALVNMKPLPYEEGN